MTLTSATRLASILCLLALAAGCTDMPVAEDPLARDEVKQLKEHYKANPLPFKLAIAVPEYVPSDGFRHDTAVGAVSHRGPGGKLSAAADGTASTTASTAPASASATTTAAFASSEDEVHGEALPFDHHEVQLELISQFMSLGAFNNVQPLKVTVTAAEESLDIRRELTLAAARGINADFVLIPRFRKYDTSYVGVTATYPWSLILCFTFWVPTFWCPDELWAGNVVLECELVNLRSGAKIWQEQFPSRIEAQMDDFDRGWDMLGPWGIPLLTEETLFGQALGVEPFNYQTVGDHLMKPAVAKAEGDMLVHLGKHLQRVGIKGLQSEITEWQTFALVVGVDEPTPASSKNPALLRAVKPLACAANDATAYADHLQRAPRGAGGVPAANTTTRIGSEATLASVKEFFDVQLKKLVRGDRALVYFAGYGATDKDGRGYLVLADTDPADLANTALPLSVIERAYAEHGNLTVILDASFSGRGGRTLPQVAGEAAVNRTFDGTSLEAAVRLTPNSFLITACDYPEIAQEYEPEGHGIFTLILLEALAQADDDSDGKVSLSEAFLWIEERVPATAGVVGEAQQPLLTTKSRSFADHQFLSVVEE